MERPEGPGRATSVFSTTTVAQIPDLSSLRVQAWVSETHVQQVRPGQEVELSLDAYPENRFRGVIKEISQSAESIRRWGKSNYFRADIEMEKLDPDIMKPGMSVKCDVLGPQPGRLSDSAGDDLFRRAVLLDQARERAKPLSVTAPGFQ